MKVYLRAASYWWHIHACAAGAMSNHSALHRAWYGRSVNWVSSYGSLELAHLCCTCKHHDRRRSDDDHGKGGRHKSAGVHADSASTHAC